MCPSSFRLPDPPPVSFLGDQPCFGRICCMFGHQGPAPFWTLGASSVSNTGVLPHFRQQGPTLSRTEGPNPIPDYRFSHLGHAPFWTQWPSHNPDTAAQPCFGHQGPAPFWTPGPTLFWTPGPRPVSVKGAPPISDTRAFVSDTGAQTRCRHCAVPHLGHRGPARLLETEALPHLGTRPVSYTGAHLCFGHQGPALLQSPRPHPVWDTRAQPRFVRRGSAPFRTQGPSPVSLTRPLPHFKHPRPIPNST